MSAPAPGGPAPAPGPAPLPLSESPGEAETPEALLRRHAGALERSGPGCDDALAWLSASLAQCDAALNEHGIAALALPHNKFLFRTAVPRLVASAWTCKWPPHLVNPAYAALKAAVALAARVLPSIGHCPIMFSVMYVLLGKWARWAALCEGGMRLACVRVVACLPVWARSSRWRPPSLHTCHTHFHFHAPAGGRARAAPAA